MTLTGKGMIVHNDTARLYRYFDATTQAEYLYQCIEETIHRDLRDEIGFLAVFDAAFARFSISSICRIAGHRCW